jgi:hypothetical protein
MGDAVGVGTGWAAAIQGGDGSKDGYMYIYIAKLCRMGSIRAFEAVVSAGNWCPVSCDVQGMLAIVGCADRLVKSWQGMIPEEVLKKPKEKQEKEKLEDQLLKWVACREITAWLRRRKEENEKGRGRKVEIREVRWKKMKSIRQQSRSWASREGSTEEESSSCPGKP